LNKACVLKRNSLIVGAKAIRKWCEILARR